jgi:exonuclease VII large subunit
MAVATPDIADIKNFINEFLVNSFRNIDEYMEESKSKVDSVIRSYGFRLPGEIVKRNSQQIDIGISRMLQNIDRLSIIYDKKISLLSKSLDAFDIQRSLKRGFVLVKQNSKFVTRAVKFNKKEKALLKFFDGEVNTN